MKNKFSACVLGLLIFLFCLMPIKNVLFAQDQKDSPKLKWWREAKFGMFIHWGIYTIPAGEWKGERPKLEYFDYSEWLMYWMNIPVKDYEQLATQFNPVKFNADDWVNLAKSTGMKYMVITSKHHDGFSMYDSKVTSYDIVDATPFKRDPLKELAEACRREGIRFGCYYSVDRDWHHPHAQGNELKQTNYWDYPDESKKDFKKYMNEFAVPQIKELLTQYAPLSILWFDGIAKKSKAQNEHIIDVVRNLQPECLINSRLGDWKTYVWGDYRSMDDNEVSGELLPYGWENPGTVGKSYAYHKYDEDLKSPTQIVRMLADIASKGGNYLLNIGPKADGSIPVKLVRILQGVGKWMDKYGESIYGTTGSPYGRFEWGSCTTKPGKVYFHIFEWPDTNELIIPEKIEKVKKVYLLGDEEKNPLKISEDNNGNVKIEIPAIKLSVESLDTSDTVVVMEVE